MPTRNVSITAAQDEYISEQLKGGGFANASELIRAALAAYAREQAAKEKWLEIAIQEGLDSGIDEDYSLDKVLRQAARKKSTARARGHHRPVHRGKVGR